MGLIEKIKAIVKGKDTYKKQQDERNKLIRALNALGNDESGVKKIYAKLADVALRQEEYRRAESYAFASGDEVMERKVCAAVADRSERLENYVYGAKMARKGGLIDRAKELYEKEYRARIYDLEVETAPDRGDTLRIFKRTALGAAPYRCEGLAKICEEAAEVGGDLWLLRAEDLYRALGDEYVKSFQKRVSRPIERKGIRKQQREQVRQKSMKKEELDKSERRYLAARAMGGIGMLSALCGGALLGYAAFKGGHIENCADIYKPIESGTAYLAAGGAGLAVIGSPIASRIAERISRDYDAEGNTCLPALCGFVLGAFAQGIIG